MMKKIIEIIAGLPKWYGLAIILAYAILTAELVSFLMNINTSRDLLISGIFKIFMQINYVVVILSCIATWIILCLLYHLTALLFNGKTKFNKFLMAASYPFILPAIAIVVAIVMLERINVEQYGSITQLTEQDNSYKTAIAILNYSFISYYLLVACVIRYLYDIKWLYALLSVCMPIFSIYSITELFKYIN